MSIHDRLLCNWINAKKKKAYPNRWLKENLPGVRKTRKKETLPSTIGRERVYQWNGKIWLHRLKKKSITRLEAVDYVWENRKDPATERRGTDDVLYINQYTPKEAKTRR